MWCVFVGLEVCGCGLCVNVVSGGSWLRGVSSGLYYRIATVVSAC